MESQYFTLSQGTAKTATPSGDADFVEVINRDGAGEIFFTLESATAPEVGADNTYCVPAAIGSVTVRANAGSGASVVRLKASAATKAGVVWLSEAELVP